jgi:hypothetical protein
MTAPATASAGTTPTGGPTRTGTTLTTSPPVTAAAFAHNGATSASDDLPIPGYDALSASQVVERLIGLTAGELEVVRTYETTHRNRRTILGKIEQLTA